ncbi:TPA: hypothetical protein ACX6SL_000886 [Photobacterium damselae]
MTCIVTPGTYIGRNGGSFQECSVYTLYPDTVRETYGRYCTIKDNEKAPPTSQSGRKWYQIYRTPDNTE